MHNNWHFDLIHKWSTIWNPAFLSQWKNWLLNSNNKNVFFHPAISETWIKSYQTTREIESLFIIGHHNDGLVFLPMVLWKMNWKNFFIRKLVQVGYSDFDYNDPLVIGDVDLDKSGFWEELLLELQKNLGGDFDEIIFSGVREDFISKRMEWKLTDICPYIDLTQFSDYNTFKCSLDGKYLKELNRRTKKLESEGKLEYHRFQKEELDEALSEQKEFFKVRAERFPKAFIQPGLYENIFRSGFAEDLIVFSRIKHNEKTISWRFGFSFDHTHYSYMPAFLPDYSYAGPGKIHLMYCIEHAFKTGKKTFDFMRGQENYKKDFPIKTKNLYTYRYINPSLSAQLKNILQKLKNI